MEAESWKRRREAIWPERARIESGIDEVVVASIVSTESDAGVVVPNDDCVVPETPLETCENADDVTSCRGESVSNVVPFDETSTWRYRLEELNA